MRQPDSVPEMRIVMRTLLLRPATFCNDQSLFEENAIKVHNCEQPRIGSILQQGNGNLNRGPLPWLAVELKTKFSAIENLQALVDITDADSLLEDSIERAPQC